jgi:uncharacterized membrane protein (DUF2068 family)
MMPPPDPKPSRSTTVLKWIGVAKLASGMLAFAVGLGMFRLFQSDVAVALEAWVRRLRLDPDNRLIHAAMMSAVSLEAGHRRLIEAGAFFYGTLHLVEGFGLIRGKNWGAFLTIIATSSLIPLELYEIGREPSALRILVLLVNAAFVVYLVRYEARRREDDRDSGIPG